jgi:hypothetical protein
VLSRCIIAALAVHATHRRALCSSPLLSGPRRGASPVAMLHSPAAHRLCALKHAMEIELCDTV